MPRTMKDPAKEAVIARPKRLSVSIRTTQVAEVAEVVTTDLVDAPTTVKR
jgi:hypothetical protein